MNNVMHANGLISKFFELIKLINVRAIRCKSVTSITVSHSLLLSVVLFYLGTMGSQLYGQVYESLVGALDTRPDSSASVDLTLGPDGNFYGVTNTGGGSGLGSVYRFSEGEIEIIGSFDGVNGSNPIGPLVRSGDGFIGVTRNGGIGGNGFGTVFNVTLRGEITVLAYFPLGGIELRRPESALIAGQDGNFYGTANFGGIGFGGVYRVSPEGVISTVAEVDAENRGLQVRLVETTQGTFWGASRSGGESEKGTLFRVDPDGTLTTVKRFQGGNDGRKAYALCYSRVSGHIVCATEGDVGGQNPTLSALNSQGQTVWSKGLKFGVRPLDGFLGNLFEASDGRIYGVGRTGGGTASGIFGSSLSGGVWSVDAVGNLAKVAETFPEMGGAPTSGLIEGTDGALYGVNHSGTGGIYRVTKGGIVSQLGRFFSLSNLSDLIEGSDGMLYGTGIGGRYSTGVLFQVSTSGRLSIISEFIGAEINGFPKYKPTGGLVLGTDGSFYGTAGGIVFRVKQNGEFSVIYEFKNANPPGQVPSSYPDGENPHGGLTDGSDGFLYGRTMSGRSQGFGGAFRISLGGKVEHLGDFTPLVRGDYPTGNVGAQQLLRGAEGTFYGTAVTDMSLTGSNAGHLFSVSAASGVASIGSFTGYFGTGRVPSGGLAFTETGAIIGTTESTVFKYENGTISTLYRLVSQSGIISPLGNEPEGGIVRGLDGWFYGTTTNGAKDSKGAVFRVSESGQGEVLFEFANDETSSGQSRAPLLAASDGNLYGTAGNSIFALVTPGSPTVDTDPPISVTNVGGLMRARVNPRASATLIEFEYGNDGTTFPNSVFASPLSAVGSKTISASSPLIVGVEGQTVFYRVKATNIHGVSYGEVQALTTLTAPTALALPASPVGSEGATLRGVVNASGDMAEVTFEYGTDGNSFPNVIPALPGVVSGDADTQVNAAVAGLTLGETYFYRVTITNSLGTAVSGTQSFRTLTPATARITTASALSTTRAQVTGFVDPKGSSASVFFEYGTDGISFPNSFSANPFSVSGDLETQVTATLTGLTQGTTYHVRIRAQGPGGTGLSPVSTFSLSILSGLVQVFPDPPPASVRSVTVNFTPPSVGAWRFTGDTEWRSSGIAAGNLTSGQRVIEFLPVPGFNRPPSETVDITSSADITLERGYFETPSVGSGSLTVSLKPDDISVPDVPLLERAQWRIVGEANWRDSGDLIGGLAAGSYLVETKPVTGKETPPTIPVSIADADARDLTLTYFTANSSGGLSPLPQTYADVSANEDLPFAHVGQIRSEVGSSTGFVVKRRVVATAGHVVFDDGTLSAITNLQWIFQRHKGTHEPRPQTPRGYYLAAGYAAQRDIDQSPGEGSAQSQNLDYASLYFIEEAGRGGYGGYLASDSGDDNEFLDSTAQKILAGYPTSGIPSADSGKLHATASFTSPLSAAFGETWTTTTVRGLGGMSGGPLFVRHQSGTYFPAAIYLGGAGQTVVRAIDSDVVELFLRAEVSGNGGDNNTDGGVTHTSVAGNLNVTQAGSLRVNIEPAGANAVGAAWQLNPEATLRQSGSQKSGLSAGTYNLKFKTIEGFQTPTIQPVAVNGGQLTTITFTYVEAATATPLETWRQTNFGTLSNTGDAADDFDFDKDGETNIEEFTAGTNPISATDVFKMTTTTKSGNTFTTTVPGKSGRTYTLLRNTTLSGTWTRLGSQGPLTSDATVTLNDPSAPSDKSFYIIEVSIP